MKYVKAYLDVRQEAVLLEGHSELDVGVILNVGTTRNSVSVDSDSGTIEDALVDFVAVALADRDY